MRPLPAAAIWDVFGSMRRGSATVTSSFPVAESRTSATGRKWSAVT